MGAMHYLDFAKDSVRNASISSHSSARSPRWSGSR